MQKCPQLHGDGLARRLQELASQERCTTAEFLIRLAEAEAEQLHLRMGYDSLKSYCVEVLHFSESAARMRVHAARVVRKFPDLLDAILEGALHLSAIRLLSAHLTETNVRELIVDATHKSENEIELMLVRRFPRTEVLRLDDGVSPQVVVPQAELEEGRSARSVDALPKPVPAKIAPLTIARFKLEVSIDAETEEDLRARISSDTPSLPGMFPKCSSARSSTCEDI